MYFYFELKAAEGTRFSSTPYKKHRAFVLNPKVVLLSRSPTIKFGIYKEKGKSKIFIFGLVTNRNDSAF